MQARDVYDDAVAWCNQVTLSKKALLFDTNEFHAGMSKASEEFGYPFESLDSLLRHVHLEHVKKRVHKLRSTVRTYLDGYCHKGKSILTLAREANFPPYMMARIIVENVCEKKKKALTEAMRDPAAKLPASCVKDEFRASESFRIEDVSARSDDYISRISREVIEAIKSDPLYGPRHDEQRRLIGAKYERVLERTLRSMGIPFETEDELRIKGTSRTPDVLLLYPIAVRIPIQKVGDMGSDFTWKNVCWIDSKAMFGDVHTHQAEVLPQAEAFVHRFGPGLILYWFGHAPIDRLGNSYGDVSIMSWNVPDQIMLPGGKICNRPDTCS